MLSGEWLEPWKASSTREGHVGQRPGRIAVADQEPAGFLVADPGDVPVEQ
jgi:hypothetical protein